MTALAASRTPTKFAYLFVADGARRRCIATNHYGDCGLNRHNQWAWIVGMLVAEFGCDPDSVHCAEAEDGSEFFTIDEKPVGYLVIE